MKRSNIIGTPGLRGRSGIQRCTVWLSMAALSLGCAICVIAETNTITSANFSLGYGADSAPGGGGTAQSQQWTDNKTAAFNTNVTGDFGLSVVFSTRTPPDEGLGSFTGPVFTGRTLGNGSSSAISSWSADFQVTLNGSWSGAAPMDAAPIPNYQLSLNITSIRIYGNANFGGSGTDMYFTETTAGHVSSSASVSLPTGAPISAASNYGQLTWDPADFNIAGTSSSRTFVLDQAIPRAFDTLMASRCSATWC